MQSTGRIVKYLANIYFKIMLHSEAAPSRFDPGNRLPRDVRILCKNSYNFFYICKGSHRQVNVRSGHREFLPWVLRLATFAAGVEGDEDECGDRVTE